MRLFFRRLSHTLSSPSTRKSQPGIGEFYTKLFDSQVGIHYVSNAPLELHGIVKNYLKTAGLPIGHIHLKHYPSGGRNLFSSWLQPAGDRKRHGLLSILDQFPKSNFLLFGDSGEMDLELYSDLAKERPSQIRGIFIRDVSTPEVLRGGNYGTTSGNGFGLDRDLGISSTNDELSHSIKPIGWNASNLDSSSSHQPNKISGLTSIQPPPQAHANQNNSTTLTTPPRAFTNVNSPSNPSLRSTTTTIQDPLSFSNSSTSSLASSISEDGSNQTSSSKFFVPYPPPKRSMTSLSSSSGNSSHSTSSIIPKAKALGNSASASTSRLFRTGGSQNSSSNDSPSTIGQSHYSPDRSRQNSIGNGGYAALPSGVTDSDLKRYHTFLDRVREAERKIPRSTVLRFFREGKDFREEAEKIVRELKKGTRPVDR